MPDRLAKVDRRTKPASEEIKIYKNANGGIREINIKSRVSNIIHNRKYHPKESKNKTKSERKRHQNHQNNRNRSSSVRDGAVASLVDLCQTANDNDGPPCLSNL